MECNERKLARLRGTCRNPSLWLVVFRRRSSCGSFSLENSRDEDFFNSPNWPFKLLARPELFEAMLGAVDTRGPGSVLIVPKLDGSGAIVDANESLEAGRVESVGLNGLNLGDRGDFGDGGALAMRITGDEAASSGCRNGVCGGSGGSAAGL